jgi:hypothetical protein
MAVAALDSQGGNINVSTLSYSVSAGTDRMLVVMTSINQFASSPTAPTGVTYGGQAMTLQESTTCSKIEIGIWTLNDAGITAASSTTISVAGWSGRRHLWAKSFSGVEQSTPAVNTATTGSNCGTLTLGGLNGIADGIGVGLWCVEVSGGTNLTATGDFTRLSEFDSVTTSNDDSTTGFMQITTTDTTTKTMNVSSSAGGNAFSGCAIMLQPPIPFTGFAGYWGLRVA